MENAVAMWPDAEWIMTEDGRSLWKKALEPGEGCLSPDDFAMGLTETQAQHIGNCPRCQAEQALWKSFAEDLPAGEEAGAVRWVAAETERRLKPKPSAGTRWWSWLSGGGRSWIAGLAAACLVVVVAISSRGPRLETIPEQGGGSSVYRSASVELMEPKGDVAAAPTRFQWTPVTGAASYEVSLMEVDGAEMWKGETTADRISIPPAVRARLVPGKTVVWKVTVRAVGGSTLYHSPTERFRVKPKSIPGGE